MWGNVCECGLAWVLPRLRGAGCALLPELTRAPMPLRVASWPVGLSRHCREGGRVSALGRCQRSAVASRGSVSAHLCSGMSASLELRRAICLAFLFALFLSRALMLGRSSLT